jgi:multiple sugar transport system ATP-binding protein
MARIALNELRKTYDTTEVVCGINLDIEHNEFVVLVGPSGCGKSTTLRMIAGLEDITDGEIIIGDRVINDVAPKDRDIALVFQNYALYPHKTVYDNMAFGLQLRKTPKAEIDKRVRDAAEILNISELLERRPKQLSGGQRQRVAMGRSIVRNPQVFLFDEPLSNLDAKLRVQMRTEIKKIHQRVKTTVVYVTHDQVEAMTLADRIVVMNDGIIEQVGTPQQMYDSPATFFVAGFIGSPSMNFVSCTLVENGDDIAIKVSDDLSFTVPANRRDRYKSCIGRDMTFGIRPEHVTEKKAHTSDDQIDFESIVNVLEPMGMDTMVFIDMGGSEVSARSEPNAVRQVSEQMSFTIDMNHMHLLNPDNDLVI